MEINKISKFTGISRQSLSKIFKEIRILMANECEKISPSRNVAKRSGEIEAGESYFLLCNLLGGVKRVRGKRGRGAANKTSVFSFAPARWNAKTRWKGFAYDGLAPYRAKEHFRVKHRKNDFL